MTFENETVRKRGGEGENSNLAERKNNLLAPSKSPSRPPKEDENDNEDKRTTFKSSGMGERGGDSGTG